MAYETFPATPDFSFYKIPFFDTVIISYGSKVEQRIAQEEDPVWQFKGKFSVRNQTEMAAILDFFVARKGSFEPFYLTDELGTQYLVRFSEDSLNIEYFSYRLYTFGEVTFQQVAA